VGPSFEDLPVLKGTYARRSFTPDLGRDRRDGGFWPVALHDWVSADGGGCNNLRSWGVRRAPRCGDGYRLPGILQPVVTADPLTGRANLAHRTGMAGDPAGARDLYTVLLPIEERVLGPEHPDTLATRASLDYWTREADPARRWPMLLASAPGRERHDRHERHAIWRASSEHAVANCRGNSLAE